MSLPIPAPHRVILLSLIVLLCVKNGFTQNLESIGKEKPLKISGGVSLNQILYGVKGIASRRDPYTYYASGNVNFSFYGWNIPLSFSLSNRNTSFQQPFNQYSIHPTYKGVTGHFGYTSISYSPYSVGGHIFLGGAIDVVTQNKFKFSSLYGRFLKAVQTDTSANAPLPSFQRMGYGFKAEYGSGADFVNLILFHAKDDRSSVLAPDSVLEQKNVLPQENLVVSVGVGKSFLKHFVVKTEFATSAISRDTRSPESSQSQALAHTNFLYTPRISSSYYKTIKSSFAYQKDRYSVGMGYERIDPQYRTLGAYYFNSDLENITVNGSTALVQGKMTLAANIGTQRDNLDKSKVSTMHRVVSAFNIGFSPSQRLNISASYSNFQTYTNIRSQFQRINQVTPYDNLDTLNFTQISQNATITTMYLLGSNQQRRQNLNFNLTFQNATDKQGQVKQNSGVKFFNGNLAYSLSLVPQNTTASLSFNTTVSQGGASNTQTMGPTLALSRLFFNKKFRTTLSSSYNTTSAAGKQLSSVVNGRVNASCTLKKKHSVNLSMVVLNRSTKTEGAAKAFTEFTGTLGYSYSF